MKRQRFASYPSCFGKLRLADLVRTARRAGMEVMEAYKPGMHCFNEIGLYGTREQRRDVERFWTENGNEQKPPRFQAIFGVNLKRERSRWVDIPVEHRDYCDCLSFDGRPCSCDFDPATPEIAKAEAEEKEVPA